jgi:hypothetical protein
MQNEFIDLGKSAEKMQMAYKTKEEKYKLIKIENQTLKK